MRAMLVTAGYGTRLRPLTDLLPKPAVPVGNRPLAWFALDLLRRAGFTEVVLNTHHLAAEFEAALAPEVPAGMTLRFAYEPEILGTGGGIRNAWQPQQGETFVVMNGKVLFQADLVAALRTHRESGALATMVLAPMPAGEGYGSVEVDSEGVVRRLLGQPQGERGPLRRMMYTGISLLDPRVHARLPVKGCLIRDTYRRLLELGERIMGHVESASFRDAGVSCWHYWEANQALATSTLAWPGLAAEGGNIVAESARVEGALVASSVVGEGARVAPGVVVERAVVWPGAVVTSDAVSEIVLPSARIPVTTPP